MSSFVLPHAGGVEQFVATIRELLEARGDAVRVLACRRPGEDASADAVVPTRFLGGSHWPLPVGGLGTLRREIDRADVVVANNSLQPLPVLSVLAARRRGVPAIMIVHGSGQPLPTGGSAFRALRATFRRTASRAAVHRALAVSVSWNGVEGVRQVHGARAELLPYPLPELPAARPVAAPAAGEPLRVAWIGRLSPEKDPELAVAAVDRLRRSRPAQLDMYGSGRLRGRLETLAATRPWLTLQGSRPWKEILAVQEAAHVVLSTSIWDNVQVALLEALARGVPAVSTRVGDAGRYVDEAGLGRFCVPPGDAGALAAALAELAGGYDDWRSAFAANGERLRGIHENAGAVLQELIAVAGAGRARR